MGASTFGVLLIHANSDMMRRWLWYDIFDNVGHYYDELFWLRAIIISVSVFAICILIDMLKKRLLF